MANKGNNEERSVHDFSDIVKKAYERGLSDQGVTVEKLIKDLREDLLKMKAN